MTLAPAIRSVVVLLFQIIVYSMSVAWSTEMGYVIAFVLFIVLIFARPGGILARRP